ncbi:phosphotransferase [Brachybacterium avium]|nr:phosphotransferase [Brachybacterium avium]
MGMTALTERQQALLARWLPGAELVEDHSWPLVQTTVLQLETPTHGAVIVKAGGPADHHLRRELRAHREWLEPWTRTGHAPRLLHAEEGAKLLVTEFLPGTLVEGHAAQDSPDTYRQAGELLARFHAQHAETVGDWHSRLACRARGWLERSHRISDGAVAALREEIDGWGSDGEVMLVPTHGDWQPRNWLIDHGEVRAIDFGRADLRPRVEDFARLARQDFTRDPRLEEAFLRGYGHDPRESDLWRPTLVTEAIGTAVWAFEVGNGPFEQVGLRQIAHLLG